MAPAPRSKLKRYDALEQQQQGFDVTCVVGRVSLDGDSPLTPYEAAFQLIAEHGATGEFQFPGAVGDTVVVTVEHRLIEERIV